MAEQDYKSQLRQAVDAAAKPLYSIFDRVEIKNHKFNSDRRSELPKVMLTHDGLATEFKRSSDADLSGGLKSDLERLENLQEPARADTLPYLFQKYGWRIPDLNNTGEKYPDASFCDTFRADRALYNPNPGGGYLLVKGDLTGIQEYIYNGIQPKQTGNLTNLSKRLRARSVLVSLLTDFIANVILRELNLDSWHLLFAGGGHFNLLMPDDKQGRLDELKNELSAAMREQFGQHLELIVADEKFSAEKLRTEASLCFEKVNAKRDELKHRQHLGGLGILFGEKVEKGKKKEIRIGGLFPNRHFLLEVVSQKKLDFDEPEEEDDYRGDLILSEFALHSYHTLLAVRDLEEAEQFLLKNKASKGEPENIQSAHILALNDTDFLPREDWKSDFDFPISFGFRFLGKNAPRPKPKDENGNEIESESEIEGTDLLDFEQIAKIGLPADQKKGDGFLRLGSLMLDVDNLGLVFSHGLGQKATLAQIITLSREMNYFFTAHFDHRARKHRVYVVYSGGDDAFAVGKWDMLTRFAKVLREDFQKFICFKDNNNLDVHFSAGLFMSNPHYPVGRFYRDARALLEEKAKKVDGKNSVDVFDHTLHWGSFEDKITLGDHFRETLEKGVTASGRKFSASFAYRIMQLVKTSYYERDELRDGQFYRRGHLRMENFARNVGNMRYLFARNGFSEADIQKLTNEIEIDMTVSFLKAFNFDAPYKARDYLVALNFAMLQLRSKTKTPT